MPEWEKKNVLVLQLGCEGGGATIFRTALPSGEAFHLEGDTITLDANDDEDWHAWSRPAVGSLGEAVAAITGDDTWILFYPIHVHPTYGSAVWDLVQAASGRLLAARPDRAEAWNRKDDLWRDVCGVERQF